MINNTRKIYKGMGFVESLIAIVVVGVASVVLMRVAASSMMEAVQNERIDKMTQLAVEGATMTETIITEEVEDIVPADRLNTIKTKLGLDVSPQGKCFVPVVSQDDSRSFDFKRNSSTTYKNVEIDTSKPSDRSNSDIVISEKDPIDSDLTRTDYFRYVCISAPNNSKYLVVKVIVGHILSKGEITGNKDVKDYIYSTMVSL